MPKIFKVLALMLLRERKFCLGITAIAISFLLFFSGVSVGFNPISPVKQAEAYHTHVDYPVSVTCDNPPQFGGDDGSTTSCREYTQTLPAQASKYQFILTQVSFAQTFQEGDSHFCPFPDSGHLTGGTTLYYTGGATNHIVWGPSPAGPGFTISQDGTLKGLDGNYPPTSDFRQTNSEDTFKIGIGIGLQDCDWRITSYDGIIRQYPDDSTLLSANAGPDQTVDEGTTVTLDGTGSTGNIASYQWEQTSGTPTVTLNNANTATATFAAPDVDADTDLVFELAVADSGGQRATDTTKVTVKNTGDFSITCDSVPDVTPGQSTTVNCTVHSKNGFNSATDLKCKEAAFSKLTCSVQPTSVTPPANGDASFRMTVTSDSDNPIGSFTVKVSGSASGASIIRSTDVDVDVICADPQVTQYPRGDGKVEDFGKEVPGVATTYWHFKASGLKQAQQMLTKHASKTPDNEVAHTGIVQQPAIPAKGAHDDNGYVACFKITDTITVDFPKWDNADSALKCPNGSLNLINAWNQYLAKVRTHEATHVQIEHRGYNHVHPPLEGFDNAVQLIISSHLTDTGATQKFNDIADATLLAQKDWDNNAPKDILSVNAKCQ